VLHYQRFRDQPWMPLALLDGLAPVDEGPLSPDQREDLLGRRGGVSRQPYADRVVRGARRRGGRNHEAEREAGPGGPPTPHHANPTTCSFHRSVPPCPLRPPYPGGYRPTVCGSSASRSPSPSKANPAIVSAIMIAGKRA